MRAGDVCVSSHTGRWNREGKEGEAWGLMRTDAARRWDGERTGGIAIGTRTDRERSTGGDRYAVGKEAEGDVREIGRASKGT